MFNLDSISTENNEDHNKKCPYIPDDMYITLIIGGSVSGKTNVLLNLIKEQDSDNLIDKIYLYAEDLNEPKYQFFDLKTRRYRNKTFKRSKSIYAAYMDDVYNNINDYDLNRKIKILIVFDDMITDIMTNKKFQAIIKELFIKYISCIYHTILFFCSRRS